MMPIYEYSCKKCDRKFELLRRITDKDDDVKCPRCGGTDNERKFSSFACNGVGSRASGGCAPAASS